MQISPTLPNRLRKKYQKSFKSSAFVKHRLKRGIRNTGVIGLIDRKERRGTDGNKGSVLRKPQPHFKFLYKPGPARFFSTMH